MRWYVQISIWIALLCMLYYTLVRPSFPGPFHDSLRDLEWNIWKSTKPWRTFQTSPPDAAIAPNVTTNSPKMEKKELSGVFRPPIPISLFNSFLPSPVVVLENEQTAPEPITAKDVYSQTRYTFLGPIKRIMDNETRLETAARQESFQAIHELMSIDWILANVFTELNSSRILFKPHSFYKYSGLREILQTIPFHESPACSREILYSFCQRHLILSWDSTTKQFYGFQKQKYIEDTEGFDVTLVAHTSVDRLIYMKYILQRWKGPISIALFLFKEEIPVVDQFIAQYHHPNKLRLTLYLVQYKEYLAGNNYVVRLNMRGQGKKHIRQPIYPINYLRDLAIMNVCTTHYVNLDMDLWPSNTLYDNFLKMDPFVLSDKKAAIILPAFQFVSEIREGCKERDCSPFLNAIPMNKTELVWFHNHNLSNIANPKQNKHRYISSLWYHPTSSIVQQLYCLNYSTMEPYVILRRSPLSPLYHPYYINYGFNKVEFVFHLRYEKFQFYILMNDFGFDVPHSSSKYANLFGKEMYVFYNPISVMHRQFMSALRNETDIFPVCPKTNSTVVNESI